MQYRSAPSASSIGDTPLAKYYSTMDRGGIVVGKDIDITIDVEALRDSDFQRR